MARIIWGFSDGQHIVRYEDGSCRLVEPVDEIAVSEFQPAAFLDAPPPTLWQRIRRWWRS